MSDVTDVQATPNRQRAVTHLEGDLVSWWDCPVCGTPVPVVFRPGRARVYCTNSCRQRAYRCRRHSRTGFDPSGIDRPADRARSRERSHALRTPDDPVARGRRDHRGRAITLCGTFGVAARRPPSTHTRFVDDVPWACQTCTSLAPPTRQDMTSIDRDAAATTRARSTGSG
jgi:hypothetical protein